MSATVQPNEVQEFSDNVERLRKLTNFVVDHDTSPLHRLIERGIFSAELRRKDRDVEILPQTKKWLRKTAVRTETDGIKLLGRMYKELIGGMGLNGKLPDTIRERKLNNDSHKMEIATRLTELVELMTAIEPIRRNVVELGDTDEAS